MSSVKVTICVPAYNAAKDLNRCIDSLLKQTLHDIEVIIVNDGSTDNTYDICKNYAIIDNRIKIINQQNSGSANARQAALNAASGEYVIVCDSDDWVENSMYEELYNKAKETDADIVCSGFFVNYNNGREIEKLLKSFPSNSEELISDILKHKISPSTCNKLIRLSFIKEKNISYSKGINYGEDLLFLLKLAQHPLKLAYINKAYYHYIRILGSKSYTNNPKPSTFDQLIYIHKWKTNNINIKRYKKDLLLSAIDVAYTGIRIGNINKEKYYKFIKEELPIKEIIKSPIINSKILLVIISKINYSTACRINKLLYKFIYK